MILGGKILISHQVRNIAESILTFSEQLPDHNFEGQAELEDLLITSSLPQILTVIGKTGSGKSSTLNALAHESFCTTTDGKPTLTRWQFEPTPEPHTHEWIESKFFPADILINLEFWDTMGLEKSNAIQRLKHIIPKSDVILGIISSTDENQDDLWDYIRTFDEKLLSKLVLIITHTDLISQDQLIILKNGIRLKSKALLGIQLPLFHISGDSVDSSQSLATLESFIQEILINSSNEKGYTLQLIEESNKLVHKQQNILQNQNRLAHLDAGFMVGIDREIDNLQKQIERQVQESVGLYTDEFAGLIPRLGKKVSRQFGSFLSPRRTMILHRLTPVINDWFFELVRQRIEYHFERFSKELLLACEGHWNQVRPRIKEQLQCDIGDFDRESLHKSFLKYQDRLGKSTYKPIQKLRIKKMISSLFKEQKRMQTLQLMIVFLLMIIAGIFGQLDEQHAAFFFVSLALGIWAISSISLLWARHRASKRIIKSLHKSKPIIAHQLAEPIQINMISGLTDYRMMYKNIKGQLAIGNEHLAPLLKRNNNLYFQISALMRTFK